MSNEYVIINKTKWLEVLENNKKPGVHYDGIHVSDTQNARVELIEDIISQSTPLIPEIEKAFEAGIDAELLSVAKINCTVENYITNLKLDI